eukprot:3419149-Rhodomonas_salina.2
MSTRVGTPKNIGTALLHWSPILCVSVYPCTRVPVYPVPRYDPKEDVAYNGTLPRVPVVQLGQKTTSWYCGSRDRNNRTLRTCDATTAVPEIRAWHPCAVQFGKDEYRVVKSQEEIRETDISDEAGVVNRYR